MRLTFATWNTGSRSAKEMQGQMDFVKAQGCDLVALQEVKRDYYEALKSAGFFAWSRFSLDIRPPKPGEHKNRELGVVIASTTHHFPLMDYNIIPMAICPERTLRALISTPRGDLFISSFHCPNGSNWGNQKALWFDGITTWLLGQPTHTLFGIDANTPKNESRLDGDSAKWWDQDSHPSVGNAARALLGDHPRHSLRDAWRVKHPDGVPPISYKRGSTKTACRYDFIYATPDLMVQDVKYLYDESLRVGSDHAMVRSELELM